VHRLSIKKSAQGFRSSLIASALNPVTAKSKLGSLESEDVERKLQHKDSRESLQFLHPTRGGANLLRLPSIRWVRVDHAEAEDCSGLLLDYQLEYAGKSNLRDLLTRGGSQ
jgi:hypothetical protein